MLDYVLNSPTDNTITFITYFQIFIIAFVASFIAGLTGLGGGLVVKPMLNSILKLTSTIGVFVSKFITTSIVFSMATKSVLFYQQQKTKIDYKLGFLLTFGIFIGVYIIGKTNPVPFAIEAFLQGILCLVIFLTVFFRDKYPKFKFRNNKLVVILVGIFIGVISTFFGIGGGGLKVAAFVMFFSMTVKEAAIYSFLTSVITEPAKIILYGKEIADLDQSLLALKLTSLLTIIAIIGSVLGASIGVRIQKRSSEKFVAHAFSAVVLYFAIELLTTGILMYFDIIEQPISIFLIFQ